MANSGFDRMGRPEASGFRQLARRLLLAGLPARRFCSTGGPHFPVRWTFDDGPDPEHTDEILEVLAEHGERGAFFMVGSKAVAHPELVRRVAAEGHLIGSHSYSHPAAGSLGSSGYLADFGRARSELEAITGASVPLLRPPHGYLTAATLMRLLLDDWQVVLWSVDPKDYSLDSAFQLGDRLERSGLQPEDVVLLHDTSAATAEGLNHFLKPTCR